MVVANQDEQSASSMEPALPTFFLATGCQHVFGNPAGMFPKLDRAQVSGGFAAFMPKTDISNASSSAPGPTMDMVPFAAIPFGYYVRPLNETGNFGLGIPTCLLCHQHYESSFQGVITVLKAK